MAISNEGCNPKLWTNLHPAGTTIFLKFFGLDPSIEMAISPSFYKQIEKFWCLSSSTPQGLSRDIFRTHVARVHVPENVS